ncbi:MAG: hypothetical protein ACAI44_38870 [Candidatus Sericytochromatia bacterium]
MDTLRSEFIVRYYDIQKYPFISLVCEVFGVKDLSLLHLERQDLLPSAELSFDNESKTGFHSSYYARQNNGWPGMRETYRNFVADLIGPWLGEPVYFQAMPTFRIHLPEQKAIHKWHYDSDSDHGHPLGELNYQIALTPMLPESATWCETRPRAEDFFPMVLLPGQFLQFNGNLCTHGNKKNTSGKTRVSLDFRVLPLRL